MKSITCLATLVTLAAALPRQAPAPTPEKAPMQSVAMDWQALVPTPTRNGQRRDVFDGRTATLDRLHAHITTLNPGENTGPLHRHPQEEIVVIKEGTIEVNIDGHKKVVGPGSVVFFSANENENMTNVGATPAVYTVIQWFTPLTPKS